MEIPGLPHVDFTSGARSAVAEPIAELLSSAEGTVLDLSPVQQLEGQSVSWAPRRRDEPTDAVFTTVVSVLRTTHERSVAPYAERLASLLEGPDALVLFAEPTRTRGVSGRLQRLWKPATEVPVNLRVHEGFRLALWRAGLTVFKVDRYELGRRAWPIGALAVGIARLTRAPGIGAPPPSIGY